MTGNRKNGQKTAGRTSAGRFATGNPGKPRGARHKATQAALVLLEGEGEALARKAVEMALNGDVVALRLCLERLVPVRKDGTIRFDLPPLVKSEDAPAAARAVVEALADGQISPADAESAVKIIDGWKQSQGWLEEQSQTEKLFGNIIGFS